MLSKDRSTVVSLTSTRSYTVNIKTTEFDMQIINKVVIRAPGNYFISIVIFGKRTIRLDFFLNFN